MTKKNKEILRKKQWLGIAVLAIILIVIQGIGFVQRHYTQPSPMVEEDWISVAAQDELSPSGIDIRNLTVDPNTADSATLVAIGLPRWMVHNLMKYRAKGGRIKSVEDMKKIYGMNDTIFSNVSQHIIVIPQPRKERQTSDSATAQQPDTIYPHRIKKDTILCLNSTDTTELQWIRGIGPYYATQIIRYREQLGGYVHVEQIREIETMQKAEWDSILPHLMICEDNHIRQIAINHCSVEQMARHPYIRVSMAKDIYTLRRQKIRIKDLHELETLKCMNDTVLQQIAPYISLE